MATGYFSTENLLASAAAVVFTNKDASTPPEYICDGKLGSVVRAGAADQTLTIQIDLGAQKAIRGIFFGGINWPANSTLRVELSNTNYSSHELLDDTDTPVIPASRDQYHYHLDTAITARYLRLTLTSPGATGIAFEIGWCWIARADFEPTGVAGGIPFGATFGFQSRTLTQMSRAGMEFHDVRRGFFQWTFNYRLLSDADALVSALDIDVDRDTYKPVLFVPHKANSNTNLNREVVLGKFVQIDLVEMWQDELNGKSYVLRECLSAEETVAWV